VSAIQSDFWSEVPPPHVAGSETSAAAADSVRASAPTYRERVLTCIRNAPGVTDEQITEITGIQPSTARPRRIELFKMGLIRPAGEARTHSGRRATRWVEA
jgi:hypothetical protein